MLSDKHHDSLGGPAACLGELATVPSPGLGRMCEFKPSLPEGVQP